MYIKRLGEYFAVRYGNGDVQASTDETICAFDQLETAVDFMRCLHGKPLRDDYHVRQGIRKFQKMLAEA